MNDTNANLYYRARNMEVDRPDNEKTLQSQSILTIMKDFIDSVNEMDETVLIPSRLMDIKVDNCDATIMNGNGDKTTSSLSLIPTSTSVTGEQPGQVSLHTYYAMLKAVKMELARGPRPENELEQEQETESDDDATSETDTAAESARLQAATAQAFREHLRGLFNILTHLTTVSKHLTNIYQEETGDSQSCLKPKSFIV